MANIVRRGQENRGEQMARRGSGIPAWDPLRAMQELLRWDPFGDRDLPSLLAPRTGFGFVPAFEVKETPESFVFRGDLPGVREDDIEIAVSGNMLTIRGRREEERRDEQDRYYAVERSYGEFQRSFALPDSADPDQVHADLKEGVLTITVPKHANVQPRRIPLGERKQGNGGGQPKGP